MEVRGLWQAGPALRSPYRLLPRLFVRPTPVFPLRFSGWHHFQPEAPFEPGVLISMLGTNVDAIRCSRYEFHHFSR
jgi:hypothetical protein